MPRVEKSRVSVNSKLTVVSSTPIGPGKTHPFTVLDHSMGLHTLHMVFYYRPTRIGAGSLDLGRLMGSLSEALSLYPAVTGRLTRSEMDGGKNWEVKCNDAGVRMLRASIGVTLDEWLRSADGSDERDLTMWEDMPEDPYIWSPFQIQINDFEGGGVAIGVSCTHLLADPTSATLLLKSWTETHRREPISQPPAFSGGGGPIILKTNTKSAIITSYAAKAMAQADTTLKMVTSTFRFPNSNIKRCLSEEVHPKFPNATPFDFLAALFWTRVARLNEPTTSPPDNTHRLCICYDLRKLKKSKLPCGYFGNALHFSLLSLDAEEFENTGHVAELLHRHVSSLEEDEFWSVKDWIGSREGDDGKCGPLFGVYGHELTCINMETLVPSRSSIYEAAMFEKDEEPVHVACHFGNVGGEGLIVVMPPSPEGGLGRTVIVTVTEDQMGKLVEDEAILQLEPTMLASGRPLYI